MLTLKGKEKKQLRDSKKRPPEGGLSVVVSETAYTE